ncbi:tRNA (adenosine(37)-N6)-threonylcarbamoyltransferase complex ATPase subunit type 1 TsaE [Rosettibacter firmus]|uniref:tRNA (adenosine(37)-N6)-threonylcarbamoyltransferase complex ATPase subunit type 1 TsaE n=1 Tax=Rosettibacter firmus TaxID=3111522 RepID=UPI00336BC473
MEFPYELIVKSESETIELVKKLTDIIKEGDVVALNGELGTGKTFFVKAFCSFFGIENVSSPSFTIVNEYMGQKKIYHFDFYRIKKITELYDLGFEDYLIEKDAIIFIEWANLWKEILPEHFYEINFEFLNDNSRLISIKKYE